ncbi:MAG: protoglobin domain-containing protein [Planctomycetota bacterium]
MNRILSLALLSTIAAAPSFTGGCAAPPHATGSEPAVRSQRGPGRELAPSPVSLEELVLLQEALLFGEDDIEALRMSLEVLRPQVEDVLDVWYGFVGSTPQLVRYFSDAKTGEPDPRYLAQVRTRFARWILDTAAADYDQDWLDLQHEIGLRHHSLRKNLTDRVDSVPIVHFRYLPALAYPITATLKPFLAKGGHDAEAVERMHQAWIKSVLLQSILWSHPYVNEGEF